MVDHVHMLMTNPPKHAVSQVVGYLKGEECHLCRSRLWRQAAELCRRALMGARMLDIINADEKKDEKLKKADWFRYCKMFA